MVSPSLAITITEDTVAKCAGLTNTLTASGANTYTWNTSATGASIIVNPNITTTYTVNGSSIFTVCNVGNTSIGTATTTVTTINPQIPAICMVSTDSVTNYQYNIVYWNNTYPNVDSFIVYRFDVISYSYLRIGAVPKDSLSEFKDTSASIGAPNGGSPLYGSWQYKLAIRDTCGNISPLSPYHQTTFLQVSGSNFSWNAYVDSGLTHPPTGYSFLRDDNGTGNFHVLVNTTGYSTTDPNYALYPNGSWRVDPLGFNCTPTYRLSGNNSVDAVRQKSHSNTNRLAGSGIQQISGSNNQVLVYPNPASNTINVSCNFINNKTIINIYDATGRLVLQQPCANGNQIQSLDMQNIESGMYFIEVGSVRKIITVAK